MGVGSTASEGEEGGASEGQGDKKNRGWLLVFIQFTHLRVCLGQQWHTHPLPAKTTDNETEIETPVPSPGHVDKVGKRREIMLF